jgi:hypothetical protein
MKPTADLSVTARNKRGPRVQLFGDSHAHAVLRAIAKREGKGQPIPLVAHRLLKEKNGVRIGTTSFESFLKLIGDLGREDLVVSMVGGNQHAVYSTIQHPQRFDFFMPEEKTSVEPGAAIIPYRVIEKPTMNISRNFTKRCSRRICRSLESPRPNFG